MEVSGETRAAEAQGAPVNDADGGRMRGLGRSQRLCVVKQLFSNSVDPELAGVNVSSLVQVYEKVAQ